MNKTQSIVKCYYIYFRIEKNRTVELVNYSRISILAKSIIAKLHCIMKYKYQNSVKKLKTRLPGGKPKGVDNIE